MSKRLGETIKEARLAKSWSLRRMAKETGLSHSKIDRLERSKYDPRLQEYKAICDALKIRINIIT